MLVIAAHRCYQLEMPAVDPIEEGRRAFARRQWRDAYAHLSAASEPIAEDLERAAVAAYLIGREPEAHALWRRAHHERIDRGDLEGAARCGFWIGLVLLLTGEVSQSAGWLARTQRLLLDRPDCAEQGFARLLEGLLVFGRGDASAASVLFDEAADLGARMLEPDLLAIALLAGGQARLQLQEVAHGLRMLDEAMVTVTAGDASPVAAGIVYCAVILTCQRIADLRRSSEWTLALERWCGEQPDLVSFRGACLVHRSEVFQLRGQWADALAEARRALAWSTERGHTVGRASYRCGELHRLRGELELAERMYQEASRAGTEPQPGMSLLRLAQGQLDAAVAAIRRVTAEAQDQHGPAGGFARVILLGPYVEIMLAAGDLEAARAGANELDGIASREGVEVMRALAADATGAVRLAEHDAAGALAVLRDAWTAWQQLGAPYESARTQVLIGRACERLGDGDTSRSHFDAAAEVFERLGAVPDRVRLEEHRRSPSGAAADRLSARECEVLSLLAVGKTNREIGAALFISEHTVARHVSSILHKLGVASRTAAAAYAFEHDLSRRPAGQS